MHINIIANFIIIMIAMLLIAILYCASNSDCSPGCIACNNATGVCSQCETNYYQDGDYCRKCKLYQYYNTTHCNICASNCLNCTNNTYCTICDIGYGLSNATCIPCLHGGIICDDIISCPEGFFPIQGLCKWCSNPSSLACISE